MKCIIAVAGIAHQSWILQVPVCLSSVCENWLMLGGTFSLCMMMARWRCRRMYLGHLTKRLKSRFGWMSWPKNHMHSVKDYRKDGKGYMWEIDGIIIECSSDIQGRAKAYTWVLSHQVETANGWDGKIHHSHNIRQMKNSKYIGFSLQRGNG